MTHLFLKNAGITNKYYDEILMKVDFDRTQFNRIAEMVSQMGKHHQTFPDDDHKHLLCQFAIQGVSRVTDTKDAQRAKARLMQARDFLTGMKSELP